MEENLVFPKSENFSDKFFRWHFCNSLPSLDRIHEYPNIVLCKWLDCCGFCYKIECAKCDYLCEKDVELVCCCFTVIYSEVKN
jgi:hypothetical protein